MALAAVDALADERRPGSGYRIFRMPAAWVAMATAVLVAGYLAAPVPGLDAWLGDTDDALRLLTVREFLAGASWFDTTLPRVGAPQALLSHWSRLLDAPLAGMIALLAPFLGHETAEAAMRFTWPVLIFASIGLIVAHSARAQAGPSGPAGTWAMAFVLLFVATSAIALAQFRPGRIDHHNVQILGAVGGILLLARAFLDPRAGWLAGALLGLDLAIGYEAIALVLPVLAAACALALVFPSRGAGITYAMIAAAATLLAALILTHAPSQYALIHCDALSLNLVAFAVAGAAGMWSAMALRLPLAPRFAIAGLAVASGVSMYASLEPACLAGPFGQVNPALGPIWLDHVSETQSIFALLGRSSASSLAQILFLLAGTAAALMGWYRHRNQASGLLSIAALIAMILGFWQIKLMPYATWIAAYTLALELARLPGVGSLSPEVTRIAAFVLLSQTTLTSLVETAMAPFATPTTTAATDAAADPSGPCYRNATIAPLEKLQAGLVAADTDLGPYIAALTSHRVVAAPYHRLDQGILAVFNLQSGTQMQARAIIARLGIDYIVTCTDNPGRNPNSFRSQLLQGAPLDGIAEIPLDPAGGLRAWRILK